MINEKISEAIFHELQTIKISDKRTLDIAKRQIAKKYGLGILKNSELLSIYHKSVVKKRGSHNPSLEILLRKRPIRSLSGIVNVSVLTKPYPCPGKCIFCPSQKGVPKSYLAGEPAVQRALFNKFNPYKQTWARLLALQQTGHPVDKVEIRVIGGTWSYYTWQYRKWFIQECFMTCNNFSSKFKVQNSKLKVKIQSLKKLQKQNEKAKCRIVSIAIETRPDFISIEEIKRMRELGITKVELGVQSVFDDILEICQRGHTVEQTKKATAILRMAGIKISYQMMPNLPGSNLTKDLAMFKEIFANPDFKPDFLKIYPLALIKETPLYQMYLNGNFKPYAEKELIGLLVEIKKITPQWCRIERIIRDIPSKEIVEGGSKILNLREIVNREMQKQGISCQCIRCREIGHSLTRSNIDQTPNSQEYEVAGGKEIFLTFTDKKQTCLFGLLRIFFPKKLNSLHPLPFIPALKNSAIIRELHIFGQMAEIRPEGSPQDNFTQHTGLGKKLLLETEKIAKQSGYQKIAVISGVGVRDYYRKLGYRLKDTYMIKSL